MDKLLKGSLKVIERINYKKYGWVLTTASIVALIFLQRGKDVDDDQKQKKDQKQDKSNSNNNTSNEKEKQEQKKDDRITKPNNDKQQLQSQQNVSSQINKNTPLQSLKDSKIQQLQNNLKKQIQELDKKQKKSNPNSSNGSLLRSSKGKYNSKQAFDEETQSQVYAMSDIESRQNLQIRNQLTLKKQRKYITDIDEPSNSYKRNQILKIAKDQNPNDGLFFQVLASLAENEDEYE